MSKFFDLLEFQRDARESHSMANLYDLWDDVCKRYDKHEITAYQLDEMKEVIYTSMSALSNLKRSMES